jgi:hypothetical protein
MSQEPQAVNEWGTLIHHPQWQTLELKWSATTQSMTDDGFKQTLQILADQGLKVRPKSMIIDATEFFHRPAEATMAWRDEKIVPLYNDAGIEKFAFLTTANMSGTVEKGGEPKPDGPAAFPTAWFETKERMYAWLTS